MSSHTLINYNALMHNTTYCAANRVICPTTIPNSLVVCNGKLHFQIECFDNNYIYKTGRTRILYYSVDDHHC